MPLAVIRPPGHAAKFRGYAQTIKSEEANCFLFAGTASNGTVQITKDVHAAPPAVKISGGDGAGTPPTACRPSSRR